MIRAGNVGSGKIFILVVAIGGALACSRHKPPAAPDAATMFATKCSTCHFHGNDMRAPEPDALRDMSRGVIYSALSNGPMRWEARTLTDAEKHVVADYLGKPMVTT